MPKPFTPSSSSGGFTLVELIVGMAVTLGVAAAALALALSTRGLYEMDQARIQLNQNLRASREFIATDIQYVGERLGNTFPVIEIIDGASGAPDELILRRNLLDTSLKLCWDISATQAVLVVALDPSFGPVAGCFKQLGTEPALVWKAYREANGAVDDGSPLATDVRAYLWDPANGAGQFFNYSSEGIVPNVDFLVAGAPVAWNQTYTVANNSQLYLLEERRYRVTDDLLQLLRNEDVANPVNLASGIEDLQLRAMFKPVPPGPTPPPVTTFGFGDAWTTLRSVEVYVRGSVPHDGGVMTRDWTSEIMPRNVISK